MVGEGPLGGGGHTPTIHGSLDQIFPTDVRLTLGSLPWPQRGAAVAKGLRQAPLVVTFGARSFACPQVRPASLATWAHSRLMTSLALPLSLA